jgi:hypothetical protein
VDGGTEYWAILIVVSPWDMVCNYGKDNFFNLLTLQP